MASSRTMNIAARCSITTARSRACNASFTQCFTTRILPRTPPTCSDASSSPVHPARAEFGQPDTTPYERIRVPTLIVAGANDKLRLPGYANELAQRIPDAEALVIDECGHCPNIEYPALFTKAVIDFSVTIATNIQPVPSSVGSRTRNANSCAAAFRSPGETSRGGRGAATKAGSRSPPIAETHHCRSASRPTEEPASCK